MAHPNIHNLESKSGTPEYNREYYKKVVRKTDKPIRRYIRQDPNKPKKEEPKSKPFGDEKPEDNVLDPIGKIKETDNYIFYRNKVWSKTRLRYLKTVRFYQKYNSYCCPVCLESKNSQLVILNDL